MNPEAMRAAIADVDYYLEQALELLGHEHEAFLTPQQAAAAAGCASSYLALARVAFERFEEAAR